MASGNFLIGKDLSLQGFELYVRPAFERRGYVLQDRLVVQLNQPCSPRSILTSVVGKGDLEKGINDALVEVGKGINAAEDEKAKQGNQTRIAWDHQVSTYGHSEHKKGKDVVHVNVGVFTAVGVYRADETASQLFPAIAQKYLLEGTEVQVREIAEQVKTFLDRKLGDLAQH